MKDRSRIVICQGNIGREECLDNHLYPCVENSLTAVGEKNVCISPDEPSLKLTNVVPNFPGPGPYPATFAGRHFDPS